MKVKDRLRCHQQWCKGYMNHNGRVCLYGAVLECYNENPVKKNRTLLKLQDKINQQFGFSSVIDFNDSTKTTFKDVKQLIEQLNV